MSTIQAFQARSAAVSAMRHPDVSRRIRETQQFVASAAFRPFQDAMDRWNPVPPWWDRAVHANETFARATSPLRHAFDQVIETRNQIGEWLARINPFQQPAKVSGLEEQLVGYRRRSIDAASAAHARLRAWRSSRSQQGPPPGRFVTTQPQVTRGPNNTRRSIDPNHPAGLVRV